MSFGEPIGCSIDSLIAYNDNWRNTLSFLNNLHFSKVFIFPSAVSLKNGVGDYIVELAGIQKCLINNSDEVIVLADSTKFETNAFYKLFDVNDAYSFVTDDELDDKIYNLYRKNNIKIFRNKDDLKWVKK